MDHLPIAVCRLLVSLVGALAIACVRAAAVPNFSLATRSPAGERVAPSHKTMSLSAWYQNRGPATREVALGTALAPVTEKLLDMHVSSAPCMLGAALCRRQPMNHRYGAFNEPVEVAL